MVRFPIAALCLVRGSEAAGCKQAGVAAPGGWAPCVPTSAPRRLPGLSRTPGALHLPFPVDPLQPRRVERVRAGGGAAAFPARRSCRRTARAPGRGRRRAGLPGAFRARRPPRRAHRAPLLCPRGSAAQPRPPWRVCPPPPGPGLARGRKARPLLMALVVREPLALTSALFQSPVPLRGRGALKYTVEGWRLYLPGREGCSPQVE